MDLNTDLRWMFFGTLFIGLFFNDMNIMAYRLDDIYISKTLIYKLLFMASHMCILDIIMYYSNMNILNWNMLIFFIIFAIFMATLFKKQIGINDRDWLKEMITHHSSALTTSTYIYNKTDDSRIKILAKNIIDTQEKEIKLMKELLE